MLEENNAAGGGGNGAAPAGSAGAGSSVSIPKFFMDNLGKEVHEEVSTLAGKDPEFAKAIPQALPDVGKAWLSERARVAEISQKMKELEEGRKPPNSPSDYNFDKPKLPEGMTYSEPLEKWFRDVAHAQGLTQAQFKALYEGWNKVNIEGFARMSAEQKARQEAAQKATQEAQAKYIADEQSALRQEWGNDFPTRLRAAGEVISKNLGPLVERLKKAGVPLGIETIRLADAYARATAEDRKLGLGSEGGEGQDEENIDPRTGRPRLKVHVAKR
jgi:hypothetical protein